MQYTYIKLNWIMKPLFEGIPPERVNQTAQRKGYEGTGSII